jgi:hypothetical protein
MSMIFFISENIFGKGFTYFLLKKNKYPTFTDERRTLSYHLKILYIRCSIQKSLEKKLYITNLGVMIKNHL